MINYSQRGYKLDTNVYRDGDNLAVCDQCGLTYFASELRQEERSGKKIGLFVCKYCWDGTQPQDLIKSVPDNPSVKIVRPDPNSGEQPLEDSAISIDNLPNYL